jgi:polar amino acid transport system permease protein
MSNLLSIWAEAAPELLSGLLVSLKLSAIALVLGLPAGLALAIVQGSESRIVRWLAIVIVELGRGTPMLVILYLFYFGMPQVGISAEAMVCAVLGLAYSTAAYTSEIFRASLHAVPASLVESASAIGLTRTDQYRFVILPLAMRIAMAPVLVFCIILFQSTSLCFAIAVPELLSSAYNYGTMTFQYLPALTLAGLLYAVVSIVASRAVAVIEARVRI